MTQFVNDGCGFGSAGRARARRDQILDSSHSVVTETDDTLVVRRWMSDEIQTWKRLGIGPKGLWELCDDPGTGNER